jgi:predicted HicB family RNase H-like nuclease
MMPGVAQLNQPIDDALHQRIRVAAAQQGIKQHEFVTQALLTAVETHEAEEAKRRRGR